MVRVKTRTIERDRGYRALMKQIRLLDKKPFIKVGYIGSKRRQGEPYTNAQVAAVNEFGSDDGHVPERSFMRSTFDERFTRWMKITRLYHSKILAGKMVVFDALRAIGVRIKSDIQAKIVGGPFLPNAPSTVRHKSRGRFESAGGGRLRETSSGQFAPSSSVKPLIDTGQLLNGIQQQLVHDGRGVRTSGVQAGK